MYYDNVNYELFDPWNINWFQNILFTKDSLFLNSNLIKKHNKNLDIWSVIKIGSDRLNKTQWNGLINSVKIYKKN
jgi:hypothetical protein